MSDVPWFTGLNLVAADVQATIDFYRLLGVDLPDEKVWRTDSGPHHTEGVRIGGEAEIEVDSQALARVYNAGHAQAPSDPATVLGFSVGSRDEVDAVYDRLVSAGYEGRQPPYDAFWGARYAIVADPDGRDVGLMSPSDPAHRGQPPSL
jgi:uncharacterized glyoxalase superfamily protein PhnB